MIEPTETFQQMKRRVSGITKKEIAVQLDAGTALHNFNVEHGKTSYHNYTRDELLRLCFDLSIDPESNYHKKRRKDP